MGMLVERLMVMKECMEGMDLVIYYLLMRRQERGMIRNMKVIPGEECVSQHHLVVGDFVVRGLRRVKRRYVPRLKVWKLKEKSARKEFAEAVASRATEVFEASDVNTKWIAMRKVLLTTKQA